MMSEVWLPALDTSLLTLKLRVYRSECQGAPQRYLPRCRADCGTSRQNIPRFSRLSFGNTHPSSTSPSTSRTSASPRSTRIRRVLTCLQPRPPSPPPAPVFSSSSTQPARDRLDQARRPTWRSRSASTSGQHSARSSCGTGWRWSRYLLRLQCLSSAGRSGSTTVEVGRFRLPDKVLRCSLLFRWQLPSRLSAPPFQLSPGEPSLSSSPASSSFPTSNRSP